MCEFESHHRHKKMKPIHRFNNGRGATLCNKCHIIITTGLTEDLFCKQCDRKNDDERFASDLEQEEVDHILTLIVMGKADDRENLVPGVTHIIAKDTNGKITGLIRVFDAPAEPYRR